jgi:hypothetical protein
MHVKVQHCGKTGQMAKNGKKCKAAGNEEGEGVKPKKLHLWGRVHLFKDRGVQSFGNLQVHGCVIHCRCGELDQ